MKKIKFILFSVLLLFCSCSRTATSDNSNYDSSFVTKINRGNLTDLEVYRIKVDSNDILITVYPCNGVSTIKLK